MLEMSLTGFAPGRRGLKAGAACRSNADPGANNMLKEGEKGERVMYFFQDRVDARQPISNWNALRILQRDWKLTFFDDFYLARIDVYGGTLISQAA